VALRLPVYDTQCGAKLFRSGPALEAALAAPFVSRWVFDVELLLRLLSGEGADRIGPEQMRELPLRTWRDVGGSTLRLRSMLRAGLQLLGLVVRSRLRGASPSAAQVPPARTDPADGAAPERQGTRRSA
jgi:hypothetical protein